jgi:hypothetical protein
MSAQLLAPLISKFNDNNGVALAGGKLFSYQAGTTTPLATYTDETGTIPNTNPVVLDSNGQANIWIGSAAYKFILQDSLGTVIYTRDNVSSINPGTITQAMFPTGILTADVPGRALMADEYVDTAHIAPGALEANTYGQSIMQDDYILNEHLSDECVSTRNIQPAAITNALMATASVGQANRLPLPMALSGTSSRYTNTFSTTVGIFTPIIPAPETTTIAGRVAPETTAITIASPAVFTCSAPAPETTSITVSGSAAVFTCSSGRVRLGMPIVYSTTGALPSGMTAGTTYYVFSILTSTTYTISPNPPGGGLALILGSGQSGTQTATYGNVIVADPIVYSTTGTLPSPLVAGTTYYVSAVLSSTTYTVSASIGGPVIATTGTQSGVHTATYNAPAVFTCANGNVSQGDPIVFSTTGTLPTGITPGTTYYAFQILSLTGYSVTSTAPGSGGTAVGVPTYGTQSGVHTATYAGLVQSFTSTGRPVKISLIDDGNAFGSQILVSVPNLNSISPIIAFKLLRDSTPIAVFLFGGSFAGWYPAGSGLLANTNYFIAPSSTTGVTQAISFPAVGTTGINGVNIPVSSISTTDVWAPAGTHVYSLQAANWVVEPTTLDLFGAKLFIMEE